MSAARKKALDYGRSLVQQIIDDRQELEMRKMFEEARRRKVLPSNSPSWPFSQVATFPLGTVYTPIKQSYGERPA